MINDLVAWSVVPTNAAARQKTMYEAPRGLYCMACSARARISCEKCVDSRARLSPVSKALRMQFSIMATVSDSAYARYAHDWFRISDSQSTETFPSKRCSVGRGALSLNFDRASSMDVLSCHFSRKTIGDAGSNVVLVHLLGAEMNGSVG